MSARLFLELLQTKRHENYPHNLRIVGSSIHKNNSAIDKQMKTCGVSHTKQVFRLRFVKLHSPARNDNVNIDASVPQRPFDRTFRLGDNLWFCFASWWPMPARTTAAASGNECVGWRFHASAKAEPNMIARVNAKSMNNDLTHVVRVCVFVAVALSIVNVPHTVEPSNLEQLIVLPDRLRSNKYPRIMNNA